MRKRLFLAALAAIVGTATAIAQQIAVVSEGGGTNVFQTLTEAIEGASNGSVIYLPGGGFQIHDSVKITKRLTIIGIGHKAKNENVDGNTVISGNLFFNEGSNYSAVMGCYVTGNIYIGNDGKSANNLTVKYCNLNSVQVGSSLCTGVIINRNYIRNNSICKYAPVTFKNNIMRSITDVDGGTIINNILTSWGNAYYGGSMYRIHNSTIAGNIIHDMWDKADLEGSVITGNLGFGNWSEEDLKLEDGTKWEDIFVKCNGMSVSPASDFHFTEEYQQYSDCGIYGGDGFSDGQLPPVPFIVAKSIPEQTDAAGNLNIKIRVKAGE